ncbi:MAG TPA: response regulator [Thermoanaerobaculia bacterium]|nr:response regulator [Thermoanaerobaculia bacterium]
MRSVLLVDRGSLFRDVARSVVRRTNCRILIARSGAEALAVARREKPDLVFLDAEMEGMTGVDVCRVLKADKQFSHRPIIVVGGGEKERTEGTRAGADGFLTGDFAEEEFFETLRRHLNVFARDAARSAAGWSITFWRDGTQHQGTIRDLSRGGFFVRTGVEQPIGARLEISFETPVESANRTIVGEAIVVRLGREPDQGLGCRFFQLSSTSRTNLEDCLKMLAPGELAVP